MKPVKTVGAPTDGDGDSQAMGIPLLLPVASKDKTAEKATCDAKTPTIARLEGLLLKNSRFFAPLVEEVMTEPPSKDGRVRTVERSVELREISSSFAKYAHNLVDAQMTMALFEARDEAMKEERRRRRRERSCSCAWMFPFPFLGYH